MKKILSVLIFIMFFFIFNLNVYADDIELKSKSAVLYNMTDDKVLYEKNADQEVYIASLTKMMTALVAIENIKDFNQKVVVTSDMLKDVTYDLSVAGFNVGNILTYDEILYGIILKSGADATEIAAYSISGSEKEFVKLMNQKAEEIGMNNSHFSNVIGIEGDNHHSTARDVMKLVKYALQNKKFKEVFGTKTYKNMNGPLKRITDSSTFNMDYVKGAKTGFTFDAGLCLATYANNGTTEFISVTIGAPYKEKNENISQDRENISREIKDSSISDEQVEIRVNNSLALASKSVLEEFKLRWNSLDDYIDDEEFSVVSGLLKDSNIVVGASQYVILSCNYPSTASRINSNLEVTEKLLERLFGNRVYAVAVDNDKWKVIKNKYIDDLKKGIKYSVKEIENNDNNKKEKSSIDDLIDLVGDSIIEYK